MDALNNIKKIRKERGLSLRDVERLSNVSHTAIEKIENFEMNPTQLTMLKISSAFKMDTSDVFLLDWKELRF